MNGNLDNLERIVESFDNSQRKNNIRGLKEGMEGRNLTVFLMEVFTV